MKSWGRMKIMKKKTKQLTAKPVKAVLLRNVRGRVRNKNSSVARPDPIPGISIV
jgi:hypothetical protein